MELIKASPLTKRLSRCHSILGAKSRGFYVCFIHRLLKDSIKSFKDENSRHDWVVTVRSASSSPKHSNCWGKISKLFPFYAFLHLLASGFRFSYIVNVSEKSYKGIEMRVTTMAQPWVPCRPNSLFNIQGELIHCLELAHRQSKRVHIADGQWSAPFPSSQTALWLEQIHPPWN